MANAHDIQEVPLSPHDQHPEDHHAHHPGFFARWFSSTNHKDIGSLYLIFSVLAAIIGVTFSVIMRLELMHPGLQMVKDGKTGTS